MEKQCFHPLECARADGVTDSQSVTLIHITHVMVIIHHNLHPYGFSFLIGEIIFHCTVMNIRQHANISLAPPQYCRQVSPGSYVNISGLVLLPWVLGLVACLSC
jgi:hypothetical protein